MRYKQDMDLSRRHTLAALPVIWFTSVLMNGSVAMALDFSADRIVKDGMSAVTAHVNAKDDRWRFEYAQPQSGANIMIVRLDKQQSWLILSKRRQYLEVPIATSHLLTVSEKMEGEVFR